MSIRVREDLPEYISKVMTKLYPFFKESLDAGRTAFFQHDYLRVDSVKYVYDYDKKGPVRMPTDTSI